MIIHLKTSNNDLKNSYQVQWWYIHEFFADSISFSVLSLVNNSLEQTHRDNIAYWLEKLVTGINMPRIHISYSLASPEECKLMRAFAQINLSQFAVRSCGERSHLQQGNDSQISYLFFSYLNLFS